jgi:RNA polymerase sigma-70 factor (ECF subfamily)
MVRDSLDRYMFGAVTRRAPALGRVRRRAIDWPVVAGELIVDNSGEHRPVVKELEARVASIIADMPLRCRQVYLLYHVDRFETRRIAAALRLTTTTVNRHHARALRLLVDGLAESEWAETLAKVLESR